MVIVFRYSKIDAISQLLRYDRYTTIFRYKRVRYNAIPLYIIPDFFCVKHINAYSRQFFVFDLHSSRNT